MQTNITNKKLNIAKFANCTKKQFYEQLRIKLCEIYSHNPQFRKQYLINANVLSHEYIEANYALFDISDWYYISSNISCDFIDEHPDYPWHWYDGINDNKKLTSQFIIKHLENGKPIDIMGLYSYWNMEIMEYMLANPTCTQKYDIAAEPVNWHNIETSIFMHIPSEFIYNHINLNWDWHKIVYKLLNEEDSINNSTIKFIKQHFDKLVRYNYFKSYSLTHKTIKLIHYLDFSYAIKIYEHNLANPCLYRYISINDIYYHPNITPEFIAKYSDKLDWRIISSNANLSIDYIINTPYYPWHFNYIIAYNKNITYKHIKELCLSKPILLGDIINSKHLDYASILEIYHILYSKHISSLCANTSDNKDILFDLSEINYNPNITPEFIKQLSMMPWKFNVLSAHNNFTFEWLTLASHDKWNWSYISNNKNITPQHVCDNIEYPWDLSILLSRNCKELTQIIIDNWEILLNNTATSDGIVYISDCTQFPFDFIEKHPELDWNYNNLLYHDGITIDFILKHLSRFNRLLVCNSHIITLDTVGMLPQSFLDRNIELILNKRFNIDYLVHVISAYRKYFAAKKIQKWFLNKIYNPIYPACQRRLSRYYDSHF